MSAGTNHAPNCSQDGQGGISDGRQFADIQFPFNFKSYQQKENGHESIVDPLFYTEKGCLPHQSEELPAGARNG